MVIEEEQYTSLLNAEDIRRKTKEFESLDLSLESEERIKSAILDIFCVERLGKRVINLSTYLVSFLPNECFYRVRKADSFSKERSLCESDFWGNPSAPQNRFNREGEHSLYVSSKIETALLETKVGQKEFFVLIEYSNILPLELSPSTVSNRYGDESISNEALRLLNNFINNLASISICDQERYKYKATRALSDVINMFPENIETIRDGMLYVSAHTGEMENIVIKGDHTSKLKFNNAWLGFLDDDGAAYFNKQIFIDERGIRIGNVQKDSLEHVGRITQFPL